MAFDPSTLRPETLDVVRAELPEISSLEDARTQEQVAQVWAGFLEESPYERIGDAGGLPGLPQYDLAGHTRHVVRNCEHLAATLDEFWSVSLDREALIAAALTHDASKLVERGPDGQRTAVGAAFLHAQLAGVRCYEVGLSPKVAYLVTYHPFTPPHVHLKPRHPELIVLTWADLAAVDPLAMLAGQATHLEIEKRFFSLD
jgi:hypothetical protein